MSSTEASTTGPTTEAPGATSAARAHRTRHRTRRLVLHYLEMLVAMLAGMFALHPVWDVAFDALGWSAVLDRPEPMALVMATNMTIGMTAVMRWRRHSWRACAEMGAAMYLPFVVLFAPMWAGLISASGMYLWGHVLMLFAMAGVMAVRPDEYVHCH